MSETIRLLREDHATIAGQLDALERELAALDAGRPPDVAAIRALLDYCLTYGALSHHRREDLVLGKLREREVALPLALGRLEDEHDALARLTTRFLEMIYQVLQGEQVADSVFAATGRDFLETYRGHIAMEETLFFPLALEALSAEDWAGIEAETADPDNRFFGERARQHFEELRGALLPQGDSGA